MIVVLYLFIVQHRDPYFHFERNTSIWTFEFNGSVYIYITEKSTIMVFGKKQLSNKLNSCCDLDFLVIISTFQSDAMVGFISDKISKQLPMVMLPPAKHRVLKLPETNGRQPGAGHSLGPTELVEPTEKCRWWWDCWVCYSTVNCRWLWQMERRKTK